MFPIFREIPFYNTAVTFSEDNPFHMGVYYVDNFLGLYLEFEYRNRKIVSQWFKNSKYEKYELGELNWMTFFFYFRITDLLSEINDC